MHSPPIFEYPEAIAFWIIFIGSFYLEILHSGIISDAPNNRQDAGTLLLISIGTNIALLFAFITAFVPFLLFSNQRIALDLGILLLLCGTVLRRYSMRILGRYFTAAVTVVQNQPVIEKGPYRWIRHPGYAGGFVMYIGIGLSLGSWISLCVFLIEIIIVYSRRIQVEEKALLETIGEPYRNYIKRTKRLIPFIF